MPGHYVAECLKFRVGDPSEAKFGGVCKACEVIEQMQGARNSSENHIVAACIHVPFDLADALRRLARS